MWASGTRKSSQGDMPDTSKSGSPLKMSCEIICCIQVVPDLAYVEIMMSSSLKLKPFQIVESKWWLWSSRFFPGRVSVSAVIILKGLAFCLNKDVPGYKRMESKFGFTNRK